MKHGLDGAFSRYVVASRPQLRRSAFLLCGDWFEADDLVQKTLIKVFLRWETLERRGEPSAYTRTVMVRTFINDRAATGRSHEFPAELVLEHEPEPEPRPGDQEQLIDRLVLLGALATLGPRQRAALVLRYWERLSVAETADVLGCSAATVRSQTSRALGHLRSLLRPPSPDGGIGV